MPLVVPTSRARLGASLLLSPALLLHAVVAAAAPTPGFVEDWPGVSTQGWTSQSNHSNPGTGGFGGDGDGFLLVSTAGGLPRNLGTVSFGAEYTGDWIAAGTIRVHLWLRDIGQDDPLEMHFSLGHGDNFWQYDVAFLPPADRWAEFVVDVSSAANWTRTIGLGTFEEALQAVDRIHVRHDLPPFIQPPNTIAADVGLDRLGLTDGVTGVVPGADVPRALELSAPFPNPSRSAVSFAIETHDSGPVTITIVDAAGRLVRRAAFPAARPGTRTWMWDGRDEAGRVAPPGAYRMRAIGNSGGVSRGLVRIE